MSNFKAGDKLKIVRAEGMPSQFKNGDIVTFRSHYMAYDGRIDISDIFIDEDNNSWLSDRFELFKEEAPFVYGILLKDISDVFFSTPEDALKYIDEAFEGQENSAIVVKIVEVEVYAKY